MLEAGIFSGNMEPEVFFTRDVHYLSDGSLLMLDAGCQNICPYEPTIYHVRPDFYRNASPSGLAGYYSADHGQQEIVSLQESDILGTYRCGLEGVYEMEWVNAEEMGYQLRQAKANAWRSCE